MMIRQKLAPSKVSGYDEHKSQGEVLSVTINVSEPGYIPPGVALRSHITPFIFTASVPAQDLSRLETDPLIVSITVGKKLDLIK